MPVQTLYLDVVRGVEDFRYVWASDGTLLLALDCCQMAVPEALSYGQLLVLLRALCTWQLSQNVVVGMHDVLVEVLTAYHDFDFALDSSASLMLVSTPPAEYFEANAA